MGPVRRTGPIAVIRLHLTSGVAPPRRADRRRQAHFSIEPTDWTNIVPPGPRNPYHPWMTDTAAALTVAALSLAVATVSLSWQVASHFLSGARVRCELSIAIHDDGDPIPSIASEVVDRSTTDLQSIQGADFATFVHDAFSVVVRNTGRGPVSVRVPCISDRRRSYWGGTPSRVRAVDFTMHGNVCRLEPGEAKTWLLPMWEIINEMRASRPDEPLTCRAAVLLGTGRWVKCKRTNSWLVPVGMTKLRQIPPA